MAKAHVEQLEALRLKKAVRVVERIVRLQVGAKEAHFDPNTKHIELSQRVVEGVQDVMVLAIDVDLQKVEVANAVVSQVVRYQDRLGFIRQLRLAPHIRRGAL